MEIRYKFHNWNDIIKDCRTSFYRANDVKQEETNLSKRKYLKEEPIKDYPVGFLFKWHISNKNNDLDNKSEKAILDGMVKAGYIQGDSVKYITKLVHEYVEDTDDYVEIYEI